MWRAALAAARAALSSRCHPDRLSAAPAKRETAVSDSTDYERIFNFRDYGGYPAAGGRLVTGSLFRSGHHHGATPADLGRFGATGVRTVIDLRGDSERSAFPCARGEGFAADVLFEPGETDGRAADIPQTDFEDAEGATRRMVAIYAHLPFLPPLAGTYRLFLAALIDRPGASMVHCFAGKDRTGIAVALVHLLTGVHRDDMMADFLRSSDPALIERRVALEGPLLRTLYGPRSDEALRRQFGVEEAYLESALAAMAARHGSIAGYAEAALGMTPARVEALRARLVR